MANEIDQQVGKRPLPEIVAMLEEFRLPPDLIYYARNLNCRLDHGFLSFGRTYKVTQSLKPNRKGLLRKGDTVTFLGASVFPYDNGLRLYFEPVDPPRRFFELEFDGNFPEKQGLIRMLHNGKEHEFLQPDGFRDQYFPKRRLQLAQAEATLRQTARQTLVLKRKADRDAEPEYQKNALSIMRKHALHGPAINAIIAPPSQQSSSQYSFDYKSLLFGHTYTVSRDVHGNRSGFLSKGEILHFVGAETQYEEEITLAFETLSGKETELVFYPTSPENSGACQPILNPNDYFITNIECISERGLLLLNLRPQLLTLLAERNDTKKYV